MPESEQVFQKRQIAYKIRISDILDSRYIKTQGFNPNYIEKYGKEISRINIIGTIVLKSDQDNYKTLVIDDGTGKISVRIFESNALLDNINIGDVVTIIGRPREFSSEQYIHIEIIKKIDPSWLKVRDIELRMAGINYNTSHDTPIKAESVVSPTNNIIKLIKELDSGEGVSIEDISPKNIGDIDKIIKVLLKEGDIFEIKPGKLKVLE